MGIRISAYAVDLPKFDAFLNTSLADLLLQYQRDGIEKETRFSFSLGNTPDHYFTTPQGSIEAFLGEGSERKRHIITEDQLRSIDALQHTAREHLSNDNIYQAYWVLEAFSNCKGINFIKRLINDHHRWWIGSLLQSAKSVLDANEYKECEHLFARILRDYKSGFNMSIEQVGFISEGLPFKPDNDPDLQFGRWSEKECSVAVSLLTRVMASSPTFSRPSGPIGIAPDDSEWHAWTQKNVLSLLQIRDLDYKVCNMLSFIG